LGAAGGGLGMRLGAWRRHQHAELPAHAVLRRGGAVRVEHVALEQDGVGDRAGGGERVGYRHGWSTPASLSRVVTVSSQLASMRSRRNRSSASSASERSRSQPVPGKCASISSRHVATGSRKLTSQSHGIGSTSRPSPPEKKTVPDSSSSNGISPPSSARKYFAAATSVSYVQGTG